MIEWYALRMQEKLSQRQYETYLSFCAASKQQRIRKYRFWEDAQRSLLGEMLLRMVLADKTKQTMKTIMIREDEYGKPQLAGALPYYFNLSHSGEWIVCSVGSNQNGIDVQQEKKVDLQLAKYCFQKQERKILADLPETEQIKYFFRLWTLKESYVKCIGKGMRIALTSFGFDFSEDKILLRAENQEQEVHFLQTYLAEEYSLAICSIGEEIECRGHFINIIEIEKRME